MKLFTLLTSGLVALLLLSPSYGQEVDGAGDSAKAAKAIAVDGTAFVTRVDGRQAILARGALLQAGETVNTSRNSTVRLRFTDGGETVVRPESSVQIQDYHFKQQEPEQDSLVMRLLRGGLRAVTGYVGKRGNQNAYKMQVNTVTVGIRGTDYSARICNVDCAGQTSANAQNGTAPVAARVAVLNGDATLRRGTDKLVPLALDKPVYSGDEIRTADNAYVILVFRDNARITVNPNSQLVVSRYAFETGRKDEPNSMFIELVKGGLRFATGLVGKVTPNAVRVRTATSTIGIRGTVFDLACAPTSASDAGSPAELGQAQCDQSLFVQTREGTVVLSGEQGPELPVAVGQNGRVDGPGAQARALSSQPEFFRALSTPEPETLQVDLDQLFGVKTAPEAAGVFVMVHEGRIEMAQERGIVSLDAGESAFAGQSLRPVKLFSSPAQIDRDPFLSKSMFNTNMCRP